MEYLTFDPKKLIISMDGMNMATTIACYEHFKETVGGFKVNHASFNHLHTGSSNIMVDYKLYDIPNTVTDIVNYLINLKADSVTINTNNSQSVFEALAPYANKIKLLGVTYLTSWTHNESYWIHNKGIGYMFERSIDLMSRYGFYGAICSPLDLHYFKDSNLKRLCPGVRFEDDMAGDQKRFATPNRALDDGADYVIMGRSIINRYKKEFQPAAK